MKLLACVVVKDEQEYIREWVSHYKRIGFDDVLIIEDYDSGSHSAQVEGISNVEIKHISEFGVPLSISRQLVFQRELLKYAKANDYDWYIQADTDEFLFCKEDVKLCLRRFRDWEGISVVYKMFDANNHLLPQKNTILAYTHEIEPELYKNFDMNYKTIINVKRAGVIEMHRTKDARFTTGEKSNKHFIYPEKNLYEYFWINHYYTKSLFDWLNRMRKGNIIKKHKLKEFFKYNQGMKKMISLDNF